MASKRTGGTPLSRYLIGIDLGTTHTVVAYADTRSHDRAIDIFPIEQLIAPGAVAARPLLPSLRYHPLAEELAPEATRLPWSEPDLGPEFPAGVVGELARELGGKTPGRLVASAKSWLSHPQVDRTAAILPWGAPAGVGKISPVLASASYLAHVRAAWNRHLPDYPLEQQDVVLTLPASFDEAARALTLSAARHAGLDNLHLLEEPQAACYDWLHRQENLNAALADTKLLLVCDVGGGTTDLTLIQVETGGKNGPKLTRIGVGDHLMLGGDNMDLALARRLEPRLTGDAMITAAQLGQLIQQCRLAKERLLAEAAPDHFNVTVLGAGAKLIGGARSAEISQTEVEELVLEGFFPWVEPDAIAQKRRGAIVEFGLPYAADPAITRHLAGFLARHAEAARAALGDPTAIHPMPDAVLLNGGVFHSRRSAARLLAVLNRWRRASGRGAPAPVRVLDNDEPDLAVARGAVAYGLARRGKGLKIGGGSARSYFLLIDHGQYPQGVCLLPRGAEEGRPLRLTQRSFALRLGQPVRFHLAATTAAERYRAGELVALADDDSFTPLPPIATVLEASTGARQEVPVQLVTELTEVGTLAVSCVASEPPERRWQLEFQLRGQGAGQLTDAPTRTHPRLEEACELIRAFYGDRSKNINPKAIKTLRTDLEKILGQREQWNSALLRELFAVLLAGAKRRRRSLDHERLWFNLTGFCLRPGFGYPLDDWRVQQLWPLFDQGVQYSQDPQLWAEWWTLWRRVAGGLTAAAQAAILDDIAPYLQPPQKNVASKGPRKQGHDDMVRLAASLEHIAPARKTELGGWLLARAPNKGESAQTWRAIGRLGARVPLYGSAHNVIPSALAADWIERVLALDWRQVQTAAFAAALLSRLSGDRDRDLASELRARVSQRLQANKAPPTWIRMVNEVSQLDAADEQRVFGEALPPGLTLVN